MQQANKIDVHSAEIKTATIEVKQLTISNRKVTQAVFKQIPEADIINRHTMELRGDPWGQVKFFWQYCGSGMGRKEHIRTDHMVHVLWQDGNELRRSVVKRADLGAYYNRRFYIEQRNSLNAWIKACRADIDKEGKVSRNVSLRDEDIYTFTEWSKETSWGGSTPDELHDWVNRYYRYAWDELDKGESSDEERARKAPILYAQLEALPQLFIAV